MCLGKAMGPYRDSRAPSWFPRTDVLAEHPSRRPCMIYLKIAHLELNNNHPLQGRIQGGGRPPKIGEKMIFWRKIVIFHTKYPKIVLASLRSAEFF